MNVFDALKTDWVMATEIRKLESRLWSKTRRDGLKVVMVTSALQGEGKSTTAAYLAAASALHRERKILAVDLDFRWPKLHTHFDMGPSHAFIDHLTGAGELEDAIQTTKLSNLDVVLGDQFGGQPDELLNSIRLRSALVAFRGTYDLILLDVPALVPVADAASLMPDTDGVLLVVMAGRSSKIHLTRARDLCLGMEANLLGLVVGNIQEAAPEYLDSSYYHTAPVVRGETPLRPEPQTEEPPPPGV